MSLTTTRLSSGHHPLSHRLHETESNPPVFLCACFGKVDQGRLHIELLFGVMCMIGIRQSERKVNCGSVVIFVLIPIVSLSLFARFSSQLWKIQWHLWLNYGFSYRTILLMYLYMDDFTSNRRPNTPSPTLPSARQSGPIGQARTTRFSNM